MGRIGRHLKAEIDKYIEQTVETRLNYLQTALTFAPSGDDSPPLKEDRIILVSVDGSGKYAAAGVLTVSQGAKAGEKVLYSRSEDGDVEAIIRLLNDGTIKMEAPGDIKISGEKTLSAELKDNASVKTDADMSLEASGSTTVKAATTTLTGGTLICKGIAAADGQGPFCGIPVCPFTGAPHNGTTVSGT